MIRCDVREATHVRSAADARGLKKIKAKYGIREDGTLRPPSEGGFGCVTEDGETVTMMQAISYWREPNV